MPRRVDDIHQPKLGATAADLGEEAYRANLSDEPGPDHHTAEITGTVPAWKQPQPHNAPPGQHRAHSTELRIGQDVKKSGGNSRRPGTSEAPE